MVRKFQVQGGLSWNCHAQEEEFAEEYIPDVPLTDSLRHAEAVNEVLRRRNPAAT